MEVILYVKQLLGVTSSDVLVLYAISILILAVLSLLCFINIIWYIYVSYFLSKNKYLLNQMEKRIWLKNFINLYKTTTTGFIMLELVLYFLSTGTIIQTSLKIVYYS
uniref:Uncharacterized protein n=1 Tax=Blastosporella zonata TaxID=530045 RepID=A0A386TY38_9AGAR|nr:hypothetical protein C0991_000058 [Blastosporella zonata]YP_009517212.1 hypothetical protein C0991_000057 [Blastosporella zonata]AYE93120.1 hypothetical protein C0991_000057 [Blastosporella zonata]AYE93121.1 hypothetical protein C0991_000058 [Blastosporella zonata]